MKKVAIFTEGQAELIFIRNLLPKVFGYEDLSFECVELHRNTFQDVPYSISHPDPSIYFLIVNVANDSKVITAIKEREQNLHNKGYDLIIGLRDMYSEAYRKLSTVIDEKVTSAFIQEHKSSIQTMSNSEKIFFCFAIMEFEAWFLSMYNLFAKIHPTLTINFIEENLGFNLKIISPEKEFFHPTVELEKIFRLVGEKYDKSINQIESISTKVDDIDINHALEDGRCHSFSLFWRKLQSLKN